MVLLAGQVMPELFLRSVVLLHPEAEVLRVALLPVALVVLGAGVLGLILQVIAQPLK